ncbi:ROK family protein [Aquimarina algicola]|uniref:ROK family protein n=1 Tax=Aquimarina algicola TaxID=2589995 RepID=A0A504IZ95_9FLAO|nr:ROK family protein [Aquimarina algicola]TPN83444.1 ROK family protein [Aquimarina algicola]
MILGVDIGGSHISVAVINENKPDQIEELYTMKVNHKDDQNLILESWICALDLAITNLGVEKLKGIGIAIPGPFDYMHGIFPDQGESKFDTLSNVNFKECIQKQLKLDPSITIRFYNDAACFGIGEAWAGDMAKYHKSIAITLGTGLGATFLLNGVPITSGKGVPLYGELYHLPFGNDIADTHFSTQWFQRRYKELTQREIKGVKELIMLKEERDIVVSIFEEFSSNLALFLKPWLKDFEAEALVIGGNISNAWPYFSKNLQLVLQQLKLEVPVYKSKLQEKAALIGGARLVDSHFYQQLG